MLNILIHNLPKTENYLRYLGYGYVLETDIAPFNALIRLTVYEDGSNNVYRITHEVDPYIEHSLNTATKQRDFYESLDYYFLGELQKKFGGNNMDMLNKILMNTSYGVKPCMTDFKVERINKPAVDMTNIIKEVIFNDPATIILWNDGTKTVVKCGENDLYDPEKGMAMCIAKKVMGNKGHYYETFKKWLPEETEETAIDVPEPEWKSTLTEKLMNAFRLNDMGDV